LNTLATGETPNKELKINKKPEDENKPVHNVECEFCHRKYARYGDLKNHQKKHENMKKDERLPEAEIPRPFKCDQSRLFNLKLFFQVRHAALPSLVRAALRPYKKGLIHTCMSKGRVAAL